MTDLIATLGVEENARAKDTRGKRVHDVGGSSANMVQRKNPHAAHKKKKPKNFIKPKATIFKKKSNEKGGCYVCGSNEHWAKECPDRKDKLKKTTNMVISETGDGGMVIIYLQSFQFVSRLIGGLTQELIFMCVLTSLCFHLIRSGEVPPC